MSSIGCGASDLARSVGGNTTDFAKRFGGNTADLAKRVGGGTADLARAVGPKRGILGIAIFAAAVGGGIYLARYLKARAARAANEAGVGETPAERELRSPARTMVAAHELH